MIERLEQEALPRVYEHVIALCGPTHQRVAGYLEGLSQTLQGSAIVLTSPFGTTNVDVLTNKNLQDPKLVSLARALDAVCYFGVRVFEKRHTEEPVVCFDYYSSHLRALYEASLGERTRRFIMNLPAPGLTIALGEDAAQLRGLLPAGAELVSLPPGDDLLGRILDVVAGWSKNA